MTNVIPAIGVMLVALVWASFAMRKTRRVREDVRWVIPLLAGTIALLFLLTEAQ